MHKYLFSIVPILYVFSKNQEEIYYTHVLCFAIGVLVLTFTLSQLFRFVFKDKTISDLFLSFGWIIFWTIHPFAREVSILFKKLPVFVLTYKWFLLLICFLLTLAIFLCLLLKFRKKLFGLNKILNVFVSLVLGIIVLSFLINTLSPRQPAIKLPINTTVIQKKQHPNVYHILLDAYTNEDTLKILYKFDNSEFYSKLKQKGFIYFPNSCSTYGGTLLSTTSMLNLGKEHKDLTESYLLRELKNNEVWQFFKANNFDIHLFSQTDLYCAKSFITNKLTIQSWVKSAMVFTQKTPIKHIVENLFLSTFYTQHIKEIYQIFEELRLGSEKYSFNNQYFYAHILNPHEPLVFDENGGVSTQQTFDGFLVQKGNIECDESFAQRYLNQVKTISKLTFDCIESILSQYPQDNQPIIILHGDHGRCLSAKDPIKHALGNLFALYIPEGWREKAKDLTFNNLYRFISNQLFSANYEYLVPRYFDGEEDITEEILSSN